MKVAIIGGAPSTEMLAPFEDTDWEIWVLGNRVDHYKRFDRIFEIHDNLSEHQDVRAYKNYLLELSKTYKLFVGEKFLDDYQISDVNWDWVIFDYQKSAELYGALYLTSSPAYMMSQAILEGATEIAIYGVDLSVSDHEYFWQRPCMEAWIGFAKGRGIKVTIPEQSHVGKSKYVEGRDWSGDTEVGVFSEEGFSAMALEHEQKIKDIEAQKHELALVAATHDGASQVYRNLAKTARAVEAQVDVKSLKDVTQLK